jgi:VanZ family protein
MHFAIAAAVSAAIVLVSPFMGQLQSFLRRSLTTQNYVLLFGVGVLAAVGFAMAIALLRIREQRAQRFGLLAAALVFGGAYMWATGTPYPEVNAVERVHFVEYGLIALLFYRAWRPAGDVSIVILPVLAGFMVGTFDEWLQWFIPVRVGEAHDVFLNLASIACGVVFAVALDPPRSFTVRVSQASARRMGMVAALAWLVFATFVSQVHLGYTIETDTIGRFHSHYTAARLDELSRERAERWRTNPPRTLRRLSQEDQYLDEGLWHVRTRNLTDGANAWRENLILERYFAPVLDTQTYASPTGNRWSAEQRANMEPNAGLAREFFSGAEPYPIAAWPKTVYWPVALSIALILAGLPFTTRSRASLG